MADRYFRSVDGLNTDSGATWDLAKASVHGTTNAAGDRLFLSQSHSEANTAAATVATAGTLAAPTYMAAVSDAAEPPVAYASGRAAVRTVGAFGITITGNCFIEKVEFAPGETSGSAANLTMGANDIRQVYRGCLFRLASVAAATNIVVGAGSSAVETSISWDQCDYSTANAAHRINVTQARFRWKGGTLINGGAVPTALMSAASDQCDILIEGLDLSAGSTSMVLFNPSGAAGKAVARGLKLPDGWTGTPGVPATPSCRNELWDSWAGSSYIRVWVSEYAGRVRDDESRLISASGYSLLMASTANCRPIVNTLEGVELAAKLTSSGAPVTASVEILHDGAAALTDADIWLEVSYMGASGQVIVDDHVPIQFGVATAQGVSSATWTGATGTGPNGSAVWHTRKLSVTFTPSAAGIITGRVFLAKASTSVYVNPVLELS